MECPETGLASARAFWDRAAQTYDKDFTATLIGQTRRRAAWRDLDRVFRPGQRILELNCGSGIDAVHLAARGIRVLACDISPRMIDLARQLGTATETSDRLDFRVLATESISMLRNEGPFDGAFSNFSGLNCIGNLSAAAQDLGSLVKPGAPVIVCMIGRFVPWEIAWFLAHGDAGQAIRRLRRNRTFPAPGAASIQHPSVSEITRAFALRFRLRSWKGIGITVPPSYMEAWARRFPKMTRALARVDERIGGSAPFRNMADQVILEFERRG
jgi:SAM-dependent methyltransferase